MKDKISHVQLKKRIYSNWKNTKRAYILALRDMVLNAPYPGWKEIAIEELRDVANSPKFFKDLLGEVTNPRIKKMLRSIIKEKQNPS